MGYRVRSYLGISSGFKLIIFFAGSALTDHEMSHLHCEKITSLQRAAFKHLRDDLLDFCMGNVANVDKRESLTKLFGVLRYFPSLLTCYINSHSSRQ